MGKTLPGIDADLRAWLAAQRMFFVATAPLAAESHVNCSPKGGGDTFRVLDDHAVAYADLTGSGVETIAHVQENGRIVLMFCAFDGPPRIVRLHGTARVLYPDDPDFRATVAAFPPNPGVRSIIRVDVRRVSDSCGFAVPLMDYRADRRILDDWAEKKGPEALAAYREEKNATSIDGIPGYGGLTRRG